MLKLNGDINTGILIRTTYLRDGWPVSGGATLLYDSVPAMRKRRHDSSDRLFPHLDVAQKPKQARRCAERPAKA